MSNPMQEIDDALELLKQPDPMDGPLVLLRGIAKSITRFFVSQETDITARVKVTQNENYEIFLYDSKPDGLRYTLFKVRVAPAGYPMKVWVFSENNPESTNCGSSEEVVVAISKWMQKDPMKKLLRIVLAMHKIVIPQEKAPLVSSVRFELTVSSFGGKCPYSARRRRDR